MEQPDPRDEFAGENYEGEDNQPSKTAGEEPHEDPWQYADLDAPHSAPSNSDEATAS